MGGSSNFDQGALVNQWMQQVTLGGVVADDAPEPRDACNIVTKLCLEASRRMPLNCPTLDLRVHSKTPKRYLKMAARTMLSGGAHPILMNDDKIVPALHMGSGGKVELAAARDYACDGCYETVFPGLTEFSFFFVPAPDVLEKALNSGAGFAASGPTNLRGSKDSTRTRPADEIEDFDHFLQVLRQHVELSVNRRLAGVYGAYGSKGGVCPSPLLSAMVDDCIELGRDFYDGGARYKMFAPLMTGLSTATDSLYVIKHLVFEEQRFSMRDLVACLRSDWGNRSDVVGARLPTQRVQEIREMCLEQPRFGSGDKRVDRMAWRLIDMFVDEVRTAPKHPMHQEARARLAEAFDRPGRAFEILLTPGVGTFEQYLFGGGWTGATPDGRRARDGFAPDFSAAPVPNDREPIVGQDPPRYARAYPLEASMSSWNNRAVNKLSDGAPSDFNIREDFPENSLVRVLEQFAEGGGSNMMTVTVANPETFLDAMRSPKDFDLVRVRMGGWTEFFIALFGAHQEHHRRRPIYLAQ